jgi:fatty acid-binding protein DegV
LKIEEHFILELGPALGVHAGPNSLVAGFQELD